MAKKINLDAVTSTAKTTPSEEQSATPSPSGETGLSIVKKKKTEVTAHSTEPTSPSAIYDKYQTRLYVIDHSGSMGTPMGNLIESEDDAKKALALLKQDMDDRGEHLMRYYPAVAKAVEKYIDSPKEFLELIQSATYDTPEQWQIRERTEYMMRYSGQAGNSRMEVVKKVMGDYITKKFQEFPQSDIRIIQFDTEPMVLDSYGLEQCIASLNSMQPAGGTNIYAAVRLALDYFKGHPSAVRIHHLILITDGEDHDAIRVEHELLDEMKELNVVVDFIYVNSGNDMASTVATSLKRVCEKTGGEYQTVASKKEFEQKFLAASNRLCLPAPVGA